MKFGASESSKKTWIAMVLAVIALFMTGRMIVSNFWPETTAANSTAPAANPSAAPAQRPAARRGRAPASKQVSGGPVTPNLDPRLRLNELKETESLAYTGEGRNIFRAQAEDVIQKPVAPAMKQPELPKVVDNTPPPPPPPPPINLRFFGFANQQGVKSVLLSSGEDVFVAKEGDIVQRRYKIVKINNNSIEVMDVLNNNQQTIPLTAG